MTIAAASDFDFVKAAVLEAGDLARRCYGRAAVTVKPDRSLVTEADVAVQKFLREKLEGRFPQDGLVGEEEGLRKPAAPGARTWVIDPIDGTAAFSAGLPVWGISVGIVEAGRPVGGVLIVGTKGTLMGGGWSKSPRLIPETRMRQYLEANKGKTPPRSWARAARATSPGTIRTSARRWTPSSSSSARPPSTSGPSAPSSN